MTKSQNIQHQTILKQVLEKGYLLEISTGKYLVAQREQFEESMKQEISMVRWTFPSPKTLTYPAELETLMQIFNSLSSIEQNTYKKTWMCLNEEEQIEKIYAVFPQLSPNVLKEYSNVKVESMQIDERILEMAIKQIPWFLREKPNKNLTNPLNL
jgi:hypothetical protein